MSTGLASWSQRDVEQQPNMDAGCRELVLHLRCVGIVLALVGVALGLCWCWHCISVMLVLSWCWP